VVDCSGVPPEQSLLKHLHSKRDLFQA